MFSLDHQQEYANKTHKYVEGQTSPYLKTTSCCIKTANEWFCALHSPVKMKLIPSQNKKSAYTVHITVYPQKRIKRMQL
jgi:hypothetical protein